MNKRSCRGREKRFISRCTRFRDSERPGKKGESNVDSASPLCGMQYINDRQYPPVDASLDLERVRQALKINIAFYKTKFEHRASYLTSFLIFAICRKRNIYYEEELYESYRAHTTFLVDNEKKSRLFNSLFLLC